MTKKSVLGAIVLAGAVLASLPASAEAVKVDMSIKDYKKTEGVSGNLISIGSDTRQTVQKDPVPAGSRVT